MSEAIWPGAIAVPGDQPVNDQDKDLAYAAAARSYACEVQRRTAGLRIGVWGAYSRALLIFTRGPAPEGGICFEAACPAEVWDGIKDAEMALELNLAPGRW